MFLCIAIVGLLVFNSYKQSNQAESTLSEYQQKLPKQLIGLDILQTSTRHYYIISSYETDNEIILTDFYSYDTKWQRYNKPLPVDKLDIVEFYKN